MITAIKIRLNPTKEQEILFRKSCGVARWSYNYFLAENTNYYKETVKYLKETPEEIIELIKQAKEI